MVQKMTTALDAVVRRRFIFFDHLATLDRRGMHLIDPWVIGPTLGFSSVETEAVLASLAAVGWIERMRYDTGERVALTVIGLTRI